MDFDIFLKKAVDEDSKLPIFLEYAIDFETGEYITNEDSNDIKILKENEALKVWCYKALKTERFRYLIYSDSYGSDLFEHPGMVYSKSVKDALIINQIQETLLVNPYIKECFDFKIENSDDGVLRVEFKLRTIYGEVDFRYEK